MTHERRGVQERLGTDPDVPDVLGQLMTAEEVAYDLRMERSTVEDYGRRQVLPSIKIGRHRRYIRSDLTTLIHRLRTSGDLSNP